jgi:hypothetical protein
VFVLFVASRCVRYVGNNRVAVVEKLWSGAGSVTAGLIALRGEAGFSPKCCAAATTSSSRSSIACTASRW